ncbi:MAG: 4-(cytidine 5'-diphospho)-2-C-methyl-D-erythritol kinase [Planctomycetota bacterium]|jgi:4-diphosphocytidyl-2-C-methyl-D-erythritol kinase
MAEHSVRAPAKINLFLEVMGKRNDGFHEIESVFQEIDLADELSVTLRTDGEVRLACDHPDLPCGEENLVVRAGRLLQREAGCGLGADIHLTKRIPMGGGLGGGSSDAAATLSTLDRLWGCGLSFDVLLALAAELGSDVPFFLYGGTCVCRGRGEMITRVAPLPPVEMLLILPEWGVSTPEAYRALAGEPLGSNPVEGFLKTLEVGAPTEWLGCLFNRFEEAVFRLEPREGELFRRLQLLDFSALRMSGSGSTIFGVPGVAGAEALADSVRGIDGVREVLTASTALSDR